MKLQNLLMLPSLIIIVMLQMGALVRSSGSSPSDTDQTYERPNRIPRNSDMVREGDGKIRWTADLDGDVFVFDPAEDHIDYTGPVRRGQEVVVNPKEDRVYVGDRVVSNENLRKDASHQIYFARHRERNSGGNARGLMVREGKGEITFRAPNNGRVSVVDADDDRLIFDQQVRSKSEIIVTPNKDRITIDGRTVYEKNLERNHTHRILFERD